MIISNYFSKYLILYFFILLISCYFSCHIFIGQRSIFAYFRSQKELRLLSQKLEQLQLQRLELEHHVKLLSANSLDLDMLEEEARKILGIAKKKEIIFYN